MRVGLLLGLVLAVLVPATLLVPDSSSQQGGVIRYVNHADPTCGGQAPCYASIQAAVNAVQAGDTIQIQAGMYVEQVLIAGKNATAISPSSRIVIQADPGAPVGSVVLQGAVGQCTQGYAIQLQQSRFITIRGLVITGAGGPAIALLGGNNQNWAIHIERNRIVGNGSASCDGGITLARGNPGTLIVNNFISGNGRNGIVTSDVDGGPHALVENTITGNGWNGVSATRYHVLLLINNAITGNGVATGSTGGRAGVKRETSSPPLPIAITLLNNLVCGNRLGELDGPILDGTDRGNLTPSGTEGPGVAASPGCENPATVYASLAGPDGILNTLDDDPTPAAGSPLIDRGLDPRTQFTPELNALLEADFFAPAVRPRAGTPGGPTLFDIGAVEAQADTQPPAVSFLQPAANAHLRQTVTVQAQATDSGSGVASLTLTADSQSLTATLAPTVPPPAASVMATASWSTTTFADGTHTLTATATDQATNTAAAQRVVIVDNTPPHTTISSGPTGEITTSSATFTYTGTDNITPVGSLVFAWRLDGGSYSSFSAATTATLTGLTDGAHSFDVKARDLAGNEDPTPPTRTFTVRFGPSISTLDTVTGPIGTLVTITGTRFTPGSTQVAFNGVAALIRTITATTITTTVPIGATTGPLTVTTALGTASQPFTVTTTGDLRLTVDPPSVAAVQGMSVTVRVGAPATGSFTGLVTLGTGPLPPGVTARFSSPMLAPNGTATLTLTTTGSTPLGSNPVAVQGTAQIDGSPVTRAGATSLNVQAPGQTMLAAQVHDGSDLPLAGVRLSLGGATITPLGTSDQGGNVLVPLGVTGPQVFLIDGSPLNSAAAFYPTVPVTVDIQPGVVNALGFVPKLHALPAAKLMPMPPGQALVVTDPELPGFTMTIAAGVQIIGWDGQPNSQVAVTSVAPDNSPLPPLPLGPGQSAGPIYLFSFGKVGGGIPTGNVVIDTANDVGAVPGEQVGLYYFNEAPDGTAPNRWEQYGTGTVSADGTRIVTDRNPATGQPYGMPRFCCGAFEIVRRFVAGLLDNIRSWGPKGGEPVDLATGRFTVRKTDLVLPGRLSMVVERTYRSENPRTGLLGVGWNLSPWESTLSQSGSGYLLTLADQSSYLLSPTGPGRWENQTEPVLRGAVLSAVGSSWQLRFKDGAVQRFDPIVGVANLWGLATLSDRSGNTVTVTRVAGQAGTTLGLRIASVTEPAGRSVVFSYDGLGRVEFLTDPLGRQVRYTYDPAGRVETVTDPAGGVTRYTYDASHRILTITDPRGITFLINEYEPTTGRVARQTQADGGVWTFAYALTGNTVTQTVLTDPRGSATTYRFNTAGFPLSQTDALGQTTVNDYAPGSNLLLSTTDPLGRVTRFTYDANGNVTAITDPGGNVRTFTYEPTFNRVTSIRDPLGNLTSLSYDAQGNLTALVDPLTNQTTLAYNSVGQVTSVTDPLLNTTAFGYDALGNLATITDPLGNTTRRTYDAASRLVSQSDPGGQPTAFAYNALNGLTQILDTLGGQTRFSYDGDGNLLTVTDARGNTTTHTYDSMDRLATRTDPGGATEAFGYDGSGNLFQHRDRKGQVATFSYDGLNRRSGASYADSTTSFTYDAGGRLLQASDSLGGTIVNSYDTLDRLLTQFTGLGTISYSYDAAIRRTGMTAPNQAPVTYGYDAASRLIQIIQGSQVVSVQYDAAGRRTQLTLPNQVSTQYQYDAASRLTALIYRNATGQLGDLTYQYDPAGNRTGIGGAFARTGLPTAIPSATYDAANRQVTFGGQTLTYDANGSLVSDGTTTYTWDARNRLTALTGPTTASFQYDALGRRARKTINASQTDFAYDGLNPVQEVSSATGVATLLTGLGIDEYLMRTDAAGQRGFVTDALGSTVALTDSAGAVPTIYTYAPFGSTTLNGVPSANAFQYTGRENDGTGLYSYRARYYHPTLQRFIAEDPIAFEGRTTNLYQYVLNGPVNAVDPLGLSSLYFNNSTQTLTLYDGAGRVIGVFPAANNTIPTSNGPWPPGTYSYSYHVAHPESGPTGSYGSYGIFVFGGVPGRSGMGVHSGRSGWHSPTEGCIRTTNDATQTISTTNSTDPLTGITVE